MAAIDLLFDAKLESERLHQLALGAILTRTRLLQRLKFEGEPLKDFGWESEGRLFDLAIRYPGGGPIGTLWVEIKVDSSPLEGQVERQIKFIEREGHERDQLLYLALGTAAHTVGGWKVRERLKRRRCHFVTGDELISVLRQFDDDLVSSVEDRDARDLAGAYRDALSRLTKRLTGFTARKPGTWGYGDRMGFLLRCNQEVPSMRDAAVDYVANEGGGFVGAWWKWRSIPSQRPDERIYLQLQVPVEAPDAKLVAKVLVPDASRRSSVRNEMSRRIVDAAGRLGVEARRPNRFGHGKTMTVAELGSPLANDTLDWGRIKSLVSDAERVLEAALEETSVALPLETYTPERRAEFLLSNAVDAEDYAAAVRDVRALGLDPDKIPHHRPAS